jgi:hypothetical protein
MRAMRGESSQQIFADRMANVLGSPVNKAQVADWERGRHVPGADVLLAAMTLAGPSRVDLPSPIGADAATTTAVDVATRLREIELRLADLLQFRRRIEGAFIPKG